MDAAVVEGENRDEPLPSAPIGAATSPEGGGFGKGEKFMGLSADFFCR